jgi:amino acid transporter
MAWRWLISMIRKPFGIAKQNSFITEADACNPEAGPTMSKKKKSVAWPALMALIFYEVSGGPFGVEDAVGQAGPILAVGGFLVLPFVWSIPEALVCAELATMFPEDCGYVIWVTAAFGPYMGFLEGMLSWTSGVADNVLYPALFLEYLKPLIPVLHNSFLRGVATLMLSLMLTNFAYLGLDIVGTTSVGLMVFTMLPFGLLVFMGIPQIMPELWFEGFQWEELVNNSDVHWNTYLNTLFWNLNYFDSVSCLAGEVEDPGNTFPRAMAAAFVVILSGYLLPLIVGTGICIPKTKGKCASWTEWSDGYFTKVAGAVGGPLLVYWVLVSAALSNVGQFLAEMSSDAFQLLGMSERGFLPKAFARRSRFGTPPLGIAFSATGICFGAFQKFDSIVELLNLLYCMAALLEFAAFLYLRWRHPCWPRPYRVPLPLWGCCLLLLPTVLMTIVIIVLAGWRQKVTLLAVVLGSCILWPLLRLMKHNEWMEFNEDRFYSLPQDPEETMLLVPGTVWRED